METNLSHKLKELRKSYGYSATKLVHNLKKVNLNFSPQSVYKWEQGDAIPNIKTIKALSEIYHCNITYLIEEEELYRQNLTPNEIFLLHLYRNDFLFRNIAVEIIRRMERNLIIY